MGLFDFFKSKKPEPELDDEGPSPDYVLAHLALRQMALSDPLRFLGIMASPQSGHFIDSLMRDIADDCKRPFTFKSDEVQRHLGRINEYPCVIIEFPEPKETAEAYFVAVIAMIDMASEDLDETTKAEARYFTLEKGFTLDHTPRTVLGEWTETSHFNFGDGPEPELKAFTDRLKQHMTADDSK